ncbi:MAG: hypothetical protein CMJ78_07365 [Planctomycetaceae bacterium]|nr:hypothetical protein [Planctomycetaceae bacterium]
MKNLLLLRHAKSSWKEAGLSDHERSLNARGKRDAPTIGKLIAEENIVPDHVASSSAIRARMTTELVLGACGYQGEVAIIDSLYLAEPQAFVEVLSSMPTDHDRIMAVAHNPGIEHFVEELSGHYEAMPTATLVSLELQIDSWADIELNATARILNVWRPKEI